MLESEFERDVISAMMKNSMSGEKSENPIIRICAEIMDREPKETAHCSNGVLRVSMYEPPRPLIKSRG